jgi:hypothetical protein
MASEKMIQQKQNISVAESPQALKALADIADTKGKLDVRGMKPFLVNMGGKPYIDKGGLELKLQEVANKRKGIKSILTIIGSYAHEDPKQMLELASKLPAQVVDAMAKERDYMAEMWTAPLGTAVAKCIILFGDGLKISAKATASRENVQMSTIHAHLDVMAQTRAFNRCVRYITANGFLDVDNMINEEEADDISAYEVADEDESFREPSDDDGAGPDEAVYAEYAGNEAISTGAEPEQPAIQSISGHSSSIRANTGAQEEPLTKQQESAIHAIRNSKNISDDDYYEIIGAYGYEHTDQLPKRVASEVIKLLNNWGK